MHVLLKQEVWWVQPFRMYKLFICRSIPEVQYSLFGNGTIKI